MTVRSGTQYHPRDPTSDIESSLANITKLLENLTTRMNNVEQEIRNTRRNWETTDNVSDNRPRPEPRQPRINDQNDFAGANFKSKKLEAPTFNGQLDLQFFLDWISDMNHYFDWYDMSDERRIRFVKTKLVGQARQY